MSRAPSDSSRADNPTTIPRHSGETLDILGNSPAKSFILLQAIKLPATLDAGSSPQKCCRRSICETKQVRVVKKNNGKLLTASVGQMNRAQD